MRSKFGSILVLVGFLLLAAGVFLVCHNRIENRQAGSRAEALLTEMQQTVQPAVDPADPAMPTTQVDGRESVGVLAIPKLEIELPILAELDTAGLKIAPCRQYGSTRTEDLVIAAHNYRRHFGRLSALEPGDTVTVTEVDGTVYEYVVDHLETLQAGDVDKVVNSDYPLVLYTCTYSRVSRTTVFCTRVNAPEME